MKEYLSSALAFARPIKFPSANWSVPLTLSAMDLGMSSGSACLVSEFCGALGFPTADRAMPHHDKKGGDTKKAHSSLPCSEKKILEPQREVEFAALALVIRKGSNFDPLLCVLSPLFSHRPTMACRVYLLTTRSEANCVSPIRRSRSA
jgi:hypothetical protein